METNFIHIELVTNDAAAAYKFYNGVFDWGFRAPGSAKVAAAKGGRKAKGDTRPMWIPYVQVADVKKSVAKVKKFGGTVALDYTQVPDKGAIAIIADPTGAMLGICAPPAQKKKTAATRKETPAAKKSSKTKR